jgi:hypothetical protein
MPKKSASHRRLTEADLLRLGNHYRLTRSCSAMKLGGGGTRSKPRGGIRKNGLANRAGPELLLLRPTIVVTPKLADVRYQDATSQGH